MAKIQYQIDEDLAEKVDRLAQLHQVSPAVAIQIAVTKLLDETFSVDADAAARARTKKRCRLQFDEGHAAC